MKLVHWDHQVLRLEKDAEHSKVARLLLADDWQPLSDYRYDRRYVYAAALNANFDYRCLVARGEEYESSQWWLPTEKDLPLIGVSGMTVTHWKPLPDDVDAFHPLAHWEAISGHKLVPSTTRARRAPG